MGNYVVLFWGAQPVGRLAFIMKAVINRFIYDLHDSGFWKYHSFQKYKLNPSRPGTVLS